MTDYAALREALAGVHNYLPTPFFPDYRLDTVGMRENVAYHVRGGCENMTITVAGGYGEGFTLDLEEHKAAVAAAVEGAQGKVHIMAGVVGGYGIQRRMARNAEEAGADSVIIFFPRSGTPTAETSYSYFRDLAESVDIGVVVFPYGEHYFWPEVLERLAVVPNVVGFFPPTGGPEFGKAVSSLVPGRYIWIAENEDQAIRAFPHGSLAYSTAAAAIVPDASREFWRYGASGDVELMMDVYEQRIEPIIGIRSLKPGYGISGIKVALEALGRAGGPTRPPDTQVAEPDRPAIADILARHPEVKNLVRQNG